MLNLVPTENWDYGLIDMIRGLRSALSRLEPSTNLYISLPGMGRCLAVRSGRAAIVLALRSLGLKPGSSVAVPLYCCPVVLRAIAESGFRARFIDVDLDSYCMSRTDLASKSHQVDAVIAVHMFGNICDVPSLRLAAPGKRFVEDCAQALGSRLGDRLAGSFGDIAIFSFRSGKYVSAGEGGAVYCNQEDLEPRISKLISQFAMPGGREECVQVLKTYVRSSLRSRPLWGLLGSRLWSTYGKKVSFASQAKIVLGRIYESDRQTAVRRLSVQSTLVSRHRSNVDYYLSNLTAHSAALCRETPGAFFNRLQFPVLAPTPAQCEKLVEHLHHVGISAARPYKDIVTIAREHYGYAGDCAQAEYVASRVLVIPCNYGLKAADLERISSSVNRAWAEVVGNVRVASVPSVPPMPNVVRQGSKFEGVAEPHQYS